MTDPVLRLEGITKRFGALLANDGISLELARGEVLALLGENGAGKTTLMNILFGHYAADEGSVSVFGRELPPGHPRAAIEAGVGMVHQHFALAPNLTVIENVVAGTEPLWGWRSRRSAARKKLAELSSRFGLAVDPDRLVSELSVGERQRVEILKPLYRDAKILILDEPTAVLTPAESESLFAALKTMAAEGLSLIFISHKLHEVMRSADRVAVLRGGRKIAERRTSETSVDELAELMVGRRVSRPTRTAQEPGAPMLAGRDLGFAKGGRTLVEAASFELRAGEVLGIIGVSGNGQSSLVEMVCGCEAPASGEIAYFGETQATASPRGLVASGVGRVPEDRHAQGAVGELTLWENAVLERLKEPRFRRLGFVRRAEARGFATDVITRFDVRGGGPETPTRLLSGGNMQKMILGRNLASDPRILIAAQPTRGLDEGAVAGVHAEILKARASGMGVLLVSEDLDEVLGLADRVQAMVKGRLSPPVPVEQLDARRLGRMMAGVWDEAA
ncbi:ABC transporter ATP-binding protein [Chenggangzhangella methanolivorans]|uniref:ABC transporter ATP-binding protein n=1 Tax=Chenggangzhangella methanolivorans TaxID=1437009 RepID=UPI003616C964